MKEGLWNIVEGTEAAPCRENDKYAKFLAQGKELLTCDRARNCGVGDGIDKW